MIRLCQLGWQPWQGKEGSVRNDVGGEHSELPEDCDSSAIRRKEESDSSKIGALATGRMVELLRNARQEHCSGGKLWCMLGCVLDLTVVVYPVERPRICRPVTQKRGPRPGFIATADTSLRVYLNLALGKWVNIRTHSICSSSNVMGITVAILICCPTTTAYWCLGTRKVPEWACVVLYQGEIV